MNSKGELALDRRFCIAPMMDWTNRHCRYWLRLLFPQALLYTEMVTTGALIHGDRERFLGFDQHECPLALQLGGNNPQQMADCAAIGEDWGYHEINMNVGCPSDRVRSGAFGACLMAEPETVAACIDAMRAKTTLPVTVKTRVGIDNMEGYEPFCHFVETVSAAGCKVFIVHARKAWLQGLSPKENRELPPLRYDYVHRLKKDFPDLEIVINGGLCAVDDIVEQLRYVDGTMIGREAYQNPYSLIDVRRLVFNESGPLPSRQEIIEQHYEYIEERLAEDVYLKHMVRHMLGMFQGQPGARKWRRYLSENATKPESDLRVVKTALSFVT